MSNSQQKIYLNTRFYLNCFDNMFFEQLVYLQVTQNYIQKGVWLHKTSWLSPIQSLHEIFFCEGQQLGSFKVHLRIKSHLLILTGKHTTCIISHIQPLTFCLLRMSISLSCFLKPMTSSAFCFLSILFSARRFSLLWCSSLILSLFKRN